MVRGGVGSDPVTWSMRSVKLSTAVRKEPSRADSWPDSRAAQHSPRDFHNHLFC